MCTHFNLHMVLILIFHGYNPLLLLIVFLLVGTVWKWAALSTFQMIMLPHELRFLQTLNSTSHVYENSFSSVLKLSHHIKYVKYTDVIFIFPKTFLFLDLQSWIKEVLNDLLLTESYLLRFENCFSRDGWLCIRDKQPEHEIDSWRSQISSESHNETWYWSISNGKGGFTWTSQHVGFSTTPQSPATNHAACLYVSFELMWISVWLKYRWHSLFVKFCLSFSFLFHSYSSLAVIWCMLLALVKKGMLNLKKELPLCVTPGCEGTLAKRR